MIWKSRRLYISMTAVETIGKSSAMRCTSTTRNLLTCGASGTMTCGRSLSRTAWSSMRSLGICSISRTLEALRLPRQAKKRYGILSRRYDMFSQQSKKNIKEYRSGMKAAKTDRYEEGWAAVRKNVMYGLQGKTYSFYKGYRDYLKLYCEECD